MSQKENSAFTASIYKYLLAIGIRNYWKVITGQTGNSNRNYKGLLFPVPNIVQNHSWLTEQWQSESVIAKCRTKFSCFRQKHSHCLQSDSLLLTFGIGNTAGTVKHSASPASMPAHSDWVANTYRHLSAIELLPHAGFESGIPLYRFVALWSRRWRSAQMQTTCEGSQK